MPRTPTYALSKKERMAHLDLLWDSITELSSKKEIIRFFEDLLSDSEMTTLARRILVAKELLSGKGYDEIVKEHGVGKSTVARVQLWLAHGLNEAQKQYAKKRGRKKTDRPPYPIDPYSFEGLKKRYPLHFLLFRMLNKDGQ